MDLIDRREAMAELYDVFFDDDLKAAYPDKADVVLDVIRKLPSAQADGDTIRQAAIDEEDDKWI